jgi:phosphoribosyl 1,2-cyclic phosphodiesterase
VEIRHLDYPPIIIDCGTGARALGNALVQRTERELDLFLSHFHLDHVFGFPFFLPIYTPGYEVRITAPALSVEDATNKLAQFLNGVLHPVRLRDVMENIVFIPVRPGEVFQRGPYEVRTCRLNHPGGAVGYRIECEGQSVAYISDTGPFAKPGEGVTFGRKPPLLEAQIIEFLRDCHVVIYDTMYTQSEYLEKMNWGHSYPEYVNAVCGSAGVDKLLLFHHSPDATDEELDVLEKVWSNSIAPRVMLAKEGCVVNVEG